MKLPVKQSLQVYAIEGALLGLFMVSACFFAIVLEHPDSPIRRVIERGLTRRALMGVAMGATAVCLIYCPWGKRSGAHMNPAVTLSAWRLGRIGAVDAGGYIAAQFAGAVAGVLLMVLIAGRYVGHARVNYVATVPGGAVLTAWVAEACIAFIMMSVTMGVNRFPKVAPYTGVVAGVLVALYITFEAPISGMSMNPARSFGSAFWAQAWMHLWIYFTAPVAGMLLAVELGRGVSRRPGELCCKQSHSRRVACHCRCDCLRDDSSSVLTDSISRSESYVHQS